MSLTREQKIQAKADGRDWAARRSLEVRDVTERVNGFFDARWVYPPDDITDAEDRSHYAYLTSASAAAAWKAALRKSPSSPKENTHVRKMTKQGIPDLNEGQSNPPRRAGRCRHFYIGPLVVVGHRTIRPSDAYGELEAEPIYARLCAHCKQPGPGF